MDLQLKDWLSITVSVVALLVAFTSFYFANIHKPASATLTLLRRTGSPEISQIKTGSTNLYQQERVVLSNAQTNVSYSLSNTGKQALCIGSVSVLRGPSTAGNLRDERPFLIIDSTDISSFVLEPGDMKVLDLSYDNEDSAAIDRYKYRLFSIELVSADGSRYQICHDITDVMGAKPLRDRLWDGIPLGGPVRWEY